MAKVYAFLLVNHRKSWRELPEQADLRREICDVLEAWVACGDVKQEDYDSIMDGTY